MQYFTKETYIFFIIILYIIIDFFVLHFSYVIFDIGFSNNFCENLNIASQLYGEVFPGTRFPVPIYVLCSSELSNYHLARQLYLTLVVYILFLSQPNTSQLHYLLKKAILSKVKNRFNQDLIKIIILNIKLIKLVFFCMLYF